MFPHCSFVAVREGGAALCIVDTPICAPEIRREINMLAVADQQSV